MTWRTRRFRVNTSALERLAAPLAAVGNLLIILQIVLPSVVATVTSKWSRNLRPLAMLSGHADDAPGRVRAACLHICRTA